MSQSYMIFNILEMLIKSIRRNERKPIYFNKYVYYSVSSSSTKTSLPYSKQEEEKLHDILDHEIDKECEEEEFEKFSEVARGNAKKVLDFIYNKFPQYAYDIYPTEDQEIAINCNPQKGKGVLVLCNSTGSLVCFTTWNKENGMFRCSSMNDFLPHLNIAFERLVDHTTKEIVYLLNEKESNKPTTLFNKNENNSFCIGPYSYEIL